ncbi:MarR family winged helix-turn-helix transcriptional regulator [Cohnella hongkongensis]|uniref:MarR family winged helix-turn-helix transcriptional regulator n=1 Tax=Cohnella hongkongensis TaxID=178337 RepID=A0ABV9F614_9BACL
MKHDGYDLNRSVGFRMGLTYRKLTALFHNRLKPFELTPEQWSVLYQIDREEGLIQKDIAERTGRDRPTTTRILDHLEHKGLAHRRADERDRRSYRVYATDRGRELIRDTLRLELQGNEDVRACMTEEEFETLMRLLGNIEHHVKNILDRE